jgi:hypothetical protein
MELGWRMLIGDHTLDQVMDLGEHPPKSTILVEVIDAVPMRAIGMSMPRRKGIC